MNYVSLLGRLTRDPEVQYTGTGKAYLRFSIAVRRDNDKDEVDFINCVAWEKRAELIAQYFTKGQRILVTGRLSVSSYEKGGEKRYSTDILVGSIEFIEYKNDENNNQPNNNSKAVKVEVMEEEDDFPF
ncbi:single-stranded DNA-binding protein [Streptobacillus canis]|uniref:single-stranded DNA-binding protein n=1 Tax=Streptobacillus canis TaxID=2678686 RepID=UPI0012E1E809|nr:single-stranded DNA-binding protein [Streptobacillus canis]